MRASATTSSPTSPPRSQRSTAERSPAGRAPAARSTPTHRATASSCRSAASSPSLSRRRARTSTRRSPANAKGSRAASDWQYEGEAFFVDLPDATGVCAGTARADLPPVQQRPRRRAEPSLRDRSRRCGPRCSRKGWVSEGLGPAGRHLLRARLAPNLFLRRELAPASASSAAGAFYCARTRALRDAASRAIACASTPSHATPCASRNAAASLLEQHRDRRAASRDDRQRRRDRNRLPRGNRHTRCAHRAGGNSVARACSK